MVNGEFYLAACVLNYYLNFFTYLSSDTLVPMSWGQNTFEELKKRNIQGDFTPMKNTLHELKKHEMMDLEKWITELLPLLESDLQNKL